ncbi:MAG: DUF4351 domain-containing protein [Clostridium sp.]
MEKKESIKLDEVLKYLFSTSNKVLVKLLNGLFDENFEENEVNVSVSGNEFIEDSLEILRGDMFYKALHKNGKDINYHIEFQTKNDSTMVIRTFEYGFKKAKEDSINDDSIKKVYFPRQKVIFFEENKNIEDILKLKIIFPNGSDYLYEVDVIKYWEYSKEEILEKKLYPLLPLQLFNLRKTLKKLESKNDKESIAKIAEKAKCLAKDLAENSSRLLKNEEIYGEDFHRMLLGIQNLIEYLNRIYFKNDKIEEEVGNMTKTLYDPEVEVKGEKKMLLKLLNKKFSNISEKYIKKINEASEEEIEKLSEDIFELEEVNQLDKYFN